VPQLIDPGANTLAFHCDFCDNSRTAEATVRQHVRHCKQGFWRRILCCLKVVFVVLGREKNNLAAKQWFYSTTCGERIKHGRKFVLHTKSSHI